MNPISLIKRFLNFILVNKEMILLFIKAVESSIVTARKLYDKLNENNSNTENS